MASLTTEQYEFIVCQLAAYTSPEPIVIAFTTKWRGVPITVDDVQACRREKISPEWQAIFDAAREAHLNAPTADKRVRIAELHRLFVKERDRGASSSAAALLLQISAEAEEGGSEPGGNGPAGACPVTAIEVIVVDPKPMPKEHLP